MNLSERGEVPLTITDRMTKMRLLRLWIVLGSVFMILLIIVYWDNVGTAHFYLHTSFSRPHPPGALPTTGKDEEREFVSDVDEFLDKLLSSSGRQNDPFEKKD